MTNPFEMLGRGSRVYHDVRPGYPSDAIRVMFECIAHQPGKRSEFLRIADIGAGTGKLTAELLDYGQKYVGVDGDTSGADGDNQRRVAREYNDESSGACDTCDTQRASEQSNWRNAEVWAVEPSADMREVFHQALPEFPAHCMMSGTAEDTGLPASSFNVVTYGQCWHWLDAADAAHEAARILKPNGVIAILYNQLAVEIPWVKRLTRIMRSGDVHRFDRPPQLGKQFTVPKLYTYDWEDNLYVKEICELGTTRSSWITSSPDNRVRMRNNLRWYLYEHLGFSDSQPVSLPYHTYMWLARVAA